MRQKILVYPLKVVMLQMQKLIQSMLQSAHVQEGYETKQDQPSSITTLATVSVAYVLRPS